MWEDMTRMHKKSLTSLFSRGSKDLVLVAECGGRVKVHAHLLALHSPMVANLLGEVDVEGGCGAIFVPLPLSSITSLASMLLGR